MSDDRGGKGPDPLVSTAAEGAFADTAAVDPDTTNATLTPTPVASASTMPIGATIGRYRITGILGRGGMGIVYAAHDPDLDRPVAIKVLRSELRHARGRLLREGQAIARLTHANVVAVFDVGTFGDDLFVAMELVHGTTLGSWFAKTAHPWRDVLARAIPAGRGLAAAHAAGIVHRDFKPDNVLLGDDGRVVVTDFGLARRSDVEHVDHEERADASGDAFVAVTRTGAILGTPAYMPLEQLRGEDADARSDQFSFCVTVWEGLTGQRPHAPGATTIEEITEAVAHEQRSPLPRGVPGWLAAALERGLSRDPAARFPSMDALLAALGPRRTRTRLIAAGAIIAAASIAVGARYTGSDRAATVPSIDCETPAHTASDAWRDARAAHRARFADRAWVDEEARWFDAFAERWAGLRRDACRNNGSAAMQTCLGAALDRFRVAIAHTSTTWPELPALDDCATAPTAPTRFPRAISSVGSSVAVLAPRADQIAVSTGSDRPRVVDVSPPHATRRYEDAGTIADWLTDGRLVFERADHAFELRSSNAPPISLPSDPKFNIARHNTVSDDGVFLAYRDAEAVHVVRVAEPDRRILTIPTRAIVMSWEPGGTRLATASHETLEIVDLRDLVVHSIPLRLRHDKTGHPGLGWIGPGTLVVSGQAESAHEGIWELSIGPDGKPTRYPELRIEDPDASLVVEDAGAGRVLASRYIFVPRLNRHTAGRTRALSSETNGLTLHALDRERGQLIAAPRAIGAEPGDVARILSLEGEVVMTAPLPVGAVPSIRDSAAISVTGAGDQVTIAPLVGAGEPLVVASPGIYREVRCHVGRDHCVIAASQRDGSVSILRLADRQTVTLANAIINVDVLADGSVLVPRRDGHVSRVTPAGKIVDEFVVPNCILTIVGASPDERVLWVGAICQDHYEIGRAERGTYQPVISGNSYVTGLEVVGADDIVYSTLDVDLELVLYSRPTAR